jgi:molecular chaperone DnaJ
MPDEPEIRYAVSISLEEAAFGCQKTVNIKTIEECSSCNGSSKASIHGSAICSRCHGDGQIYRSYPMPIDIPTGVEDGYQLHIDTRAAHDQTGKIPEELIVLVSVKAHSVFQRNGADITYELPLNFSQAALGTEVTVPTIKGKTKLKIPPGAQTGKILRLKGKGIPHFGRHGRGDQLVKILVVTPIELDEHQRWLLKQLAEKLPQPRVEKRKKRS